jgi:hypothetical protein
MREIIKQKDHKGKYGFYQSTSMPLRLIMCATSCSTCAWVWIISSPNVFIRDEQRHLHQHAYLLSPENTGTMWLAGPGRAGTYAIQ